MQQRKRAHVTRDRHNNVTTTQQRLTSTPWNQQDQCQSPVKQSHTVPCSSAEVQVLIPAVQCVSMQWFRQRSSHSASSCSSQSVSQSGQDQLHDSHGNTNITRLLSYTEPVHSVESKTAVMSCWHAGLLHWWRRWWRLFISYSSDRLD